jgi:MinD-like ATPase involved in chromosome partitioning or flagellar assembly
MYRHRFFPQESVALRARTSGVPVLIALWSAKGGSGTTVVAAVLALLHARRTGAVLADLAGDIPAVLGLPEPAGPGLNAWLAADDDVGSDALERLTVPGGDGLDVLPTGPPGPPPRPGRGSELAHALALDGRPVIVDAGTSPTGAALDVVAAANHALLVLRPCYLALRRATAAPLRPSGIVLVREPGRALGRRDVEEALAVPVRAEVDVDPSVARAVDAGLLGARLPRSLCQGLRGAA